VSASNGKLIVGVVGEAPGLDEVARALAHHDEIELLPGTVDTLVASDVDAVLLATPHPELPWSELGAIAEQTRAPVILLGPGTAPHLLAEALGAEIADALLMPQPAETVLFAVRKAVGGRPPALAAPLPQGLIVGVFSPKGGTGKSVTATNLAVALASCEHRRTLLVDLDLQFGDSAIMLALDPQQTIYDLVTAPGELDAEKLAGYTVAHESGLHVVAAPDRPEEAESITQPKVGSLLEVARGAYDVVVIDTAPFLHGPVLAALDHLDVLLLLTTLDVPALKDVRQSLQTLELLRFPEDRIAMVLNRATAKVGITRADAEAALGRRMRYALPSADEVPLAVNRGRPVVLVEPRSEFAEAMRALAADVAARRPVPSSAFAAAP
jgi:pilus assembly protein CpaE